MTTFLSLLALGTGCANEDEDTGAEEIRSTIDDDLNEVDAARSNWEGTAEGVGLIAFLNDKGTTFDLLDKTVRLDRRAAGNLVAHRDGGDRLWGTSDDDIYNTVDEIDAVRFVGPRTIDRMIEFAARNGWVPGAQDILGIYDGVAFTVEEADATVALANELNEYELDQGLRLHSRAAESIVLAQPIATIDELARLYYVGGSALSKLKYYAALNDKTVQE
tara:strand:+ start:877 stop:1533 length:657 start_codon:yes stop_codon:yes gene_type:complete